MKKFNREFKRYICECLYFAGTDFNIRLVWLPEDQKYTTTIFFTDHTIVNLMKAEIIL